MPVQELEVRFEKRCSEIVFQNVVLFAMHRMIALPGLSYQ